MKFKLKFKNLKILDPTLCTFSWGSRSVSVKETWLKFNYEKPVDACIDLNNFKSFTKKQLFIDCVVFNVAWTNKSLCRIVAMYHKKIILNVPLHCTLQFNRDFSRAGSSINSHQRKEWTHLSFVSWVMQLSTGIYGDTGKSLAGPGLKVLLRCQFNTTD